MLHYFQTHVLPLKVVQLLVRTGLKWQQDNCAGMSAALSYYALFSLFPILLVLLSVLGAFLGPGTEAVQHIQTVAARSLPPEAYSLVESTVQNLYRASTGAGAIGFGLLLYSASTVFSVLNASVNRIWLSPIAQAVATPETVGGIGRSIFRFVTNRVLAFVLVLSMALLLLVSMVSHLVVQSLLKLVAALGDTLISLPMADWQVADSLQRGSSFFVLALTNLILLKILPMTPVAWKDVWPGALLTSGLLVGLQRLISTSVISVGSHYLSYGVVGSVMILLLWIYFTFQIFFLGCEFSYVFAHLFGSYRGRSAESTEGPLRG